MAAPIPRVSLDSLQSPAHAALTPSGEPGGKLVKFISEKPDRADQVEDNANDSDRLGAKSVECGGLAWVELIDRNDSQHLSLQVCHCSIFDFQSLGYSWT